MTRTRLKPHRFWLAHKWIAEGVTFAFGMAAFVALYVVT